MEDAVPTAHHPPGLQTSDSGLPAVEPPERVLTAPPTKARLRGKPRISEDGSDSPPLLERHHLFASTVKLAGHRFSCVQHVSQDWPAGSTTSVSVPSAPLSARVSRPHTFDVGGDGTSWGSASTAWRAPPKSARTSREFGSQASPSSLQNSRADLLSTTSLGNRSHMSRIGVPIRHWTLPRQDAIPCAVTGRRRDQSLETGDADIRIFIRLPGGNRFAVWVPPDMPVGPLPASESNEDRDFSGSLRQSITGSHITSGSNIVDTSGSPPSRLRKADGRLTPVRALLAQTAESHYGDLSIDVSGDDDDDFEVSQGSLVHGTLKDLIEAATGIPAKLQKLVVGRRGPLQDANKPICMYDVGHGALLHLSIKSTGSRKEVQHLACTALKEQNAKSHDSSFLYENMDQFMQSNASRGSRAAKDLVEPLPDWHVSMTHEPKSATARSSELYYQDYTYLRDNHIFDLADRIRKRFRALPRLAKSVAAPEHQQIVQEAVRQCPVTGRRRSITETKGFAPMTPKSPQRQITPRDTPSAKSRSRNRETLEWVSMLQQERQFDDKHRYSVKRDPSTGFTLPSPVS